jgi:hypothetical protein
MMTKIYKIFSFGLVTVLGLSACSDKFLEDKKNYDNATTDIYNYVSGCNGRVNDIYGWCLPAVGDLGSGQSFLSIAIGNADAAGKSTEEYYGFSDFVNPEIELSSMDNNPVPDYFMGSNNNIQTSVYGRIRNINDCLKGIEGGSLTQEEKDPLLGQVLFFRAWCYYNLVKWYGGVPIVTEVLDPVESSYTPRATTKECIEFILKDLDDAAEKLKGKIWTGSDYGRVTSGTALALKGRVLLLWASPMFNRKNDPNRWQNAYTQMKADLSTINGCGYGFYSTSNNVNGSDFAKQFLVVSGNPESVFVTLHNNVASDDGLDNQKNNRWERDIRPANTGGGGKNAGLALVELFPMADGKIPNLTNLTPLDKAGARSYRDTYSKLERSQLDYDQNAPFMNRDPRFYRTFAFPGFRWAYDGDPTQRDAHNPSYNSGKDYVLWNYKWYVEKSEAGNVENGNSYSADNLYTSNVGVYVRKKSDDYDLGSKLYNYEPLGSKGAGPYFSQAPLIELRYTEVIMNLAEAACMAGHMDEAVTYLQQIRKRAGYTAENNYGLQANLASDQQACMSAILYERQIEFAYEGKRFDDLRRWMLFDGGTQLPEGAPSTWQMTGFGGNTCTWLGFTQMNGQRRERVEFRTADQFGVGTQFWDGDPLVAAGVERPAGVDFRQADITTQLNELRVWYNNNLVPQYKLGDGQDAQKNVEYMRFLPKYYFLGLSSGAQNSNKGLPQTIGWQDYNNGGAMGTFDPLAE